MRRLALSMVALALAGAAPAHSQSLNADKPLGYSAEPSDPMVRHQKATVGANLDEWAHNLDSSNSDARLEAVKLLGQSGDPRASEYLMHAVESTDPRVSMAAVDYLGKSGAKDATEFLSERLFSSGANAVVQQHILVALGRIRDPAGARRVLSFIEAEKNPELRAIAIRVIGEIGDEAVKGDVQALSARESDPNAKMLLQDAVATIEVNHGRASGGKTGSLSEFSHSENPNLPR